MTNSLDMTPGLKRTISLPSATFIIIGYVVGATIFILPGSLAADAGPVSAAARTAAARTTPSTFLISLPPFSSVYLGFPQRTLTQGA